LQPDFLGDIGERAVAVVVKGRNAAAVVRRLETFRKKPRRFGIEQVHGLKIVADEQIDEAVVIVIERNRRNRVEIAIDAGALRDVPEPSLAEILEQLTVSEADDEEIGPAVVVEIE